MEKCLKGKITGLWNPETLHFCNWPNNNVIKSPIIWFTGFLFFYILSLQVELYPWVNCQTFIVLLSGTTWTIGGWLNSLLCCPTTLCCQSAFGGLRFRVLQKNRDRIHWNWRFQFFFIVPAILSIPQHIHWI